MKRYVAVAGTIGSGKSSLVAWLVKRYGLVPYYGCALKIRASSEFETLPQNSTRRAFTRPVPSEIVLVTAKVSCRNSPCRI
jgi:hypothetical protein